MLARRPSRFHRYRAVMLVDRCRSAVVRPRDVLSGTVRVIHAEDAYLCPKLCLSARQRLHMRLDATRRRRVVLSKMTNV